MEIGGKKLRKKSYTLVHPIREFLGFSKGNVTGSFAHCILRISHMRTTGFKGALWDAQRMIEVVLDYSGYVRLPIEYHFMLYVAMILQPNCAISNWK